MAIIDNATDLLTHHSELIQGLLIDLADERQRRIDCENELARLRDGKRMEELRRAVATRIQIGCVRALLRARDLTRSTHPHLGSAGGQRSQMAPGCAFPGGSLLCEQRASH